MKKTIVVLVSFAVLLIFAYAGASYYIATQATVARRVAPNQNPGQLGLDYQKCIFLSRDKSVVLSGWFIPVNLEEEAVGSIIMTHGLDINRADPVVRNLDIAARFHEQGFNVLMFDLRGHGLSGSGKLSGGQFEQEDILGAYDFLVSQGYKPGNIGLWGVSLGAATSILAAAREPGIAAVVADGSFADLKDMLATEIPARAPVPAWLARALIPGAIVAAKLFYGIEIEKIAPEKAVAKINYPLFFIHCSEDPRVSPKFAHRLKAASPDSTLWEASCPGHSEAFSLHPIQYMSRVGYYFFVRFKLAAEQQKCSSCQ